jgi:hypothetical protein
MDSTREQISMLSLQQPVTYTGSAMNELVLARQRCTDLTCKPGPRITWRAVTAHQWQGMGYLLAGVGLFPGGFLAIGYDAGPAVFSWLVLVPAVLSLVSIQLRRYRLAALLSLAGAGLAGVSAVIGCYMLYVLLGWVVEVLPTMGWNLTVVVLACVLFCSLLATTSVQFARTVPTLWQYRAD